MDTSSRKPSHPQTPSALGFPSHTWMTCAVPASGRGCPHPIASPGWSSEEPQPGTRAHQGPQKPGVGSCPGLHVPCSLHLGPGVGARPLGHNCSRSAPPPRALKACLGAAGRAARGSSSAISEHRFPQRQLSCPRGQKTRAGPHSARGTPGTKATSLCTPKPLSLGPRSVICAKGGKVETEGAPSLVGRGCKVGGHERQEQTW